MRYRSDRDSCSRSCSVRSPGSKGRYVEVLLQEQRREPGREVPVAAVPYQKRPWEVRASQHSSQHPLLRTLSRTSSTPPFWVPRSPPGQ